METDEQAAGLARRGHLGLSIEPARREPERPRATKALIALKAGEHIDEALATLVDLMRTATRESVKAQAAVALLKFAAESEPEDDAGRTTVLLVATGPGAQDAVASAREEMRRRRLGQ